MYGFMDFSFSNLAGRSLHHSKKCKIGYPLVQFMHESIMHIARLLRPLKYLEEDFDSGLSILLRMSHSLYLQMLIAFIEYFILSSLTMMLILFSEKMCKMFPFSLSSINSQLNSFLGLLTNNVSSFFRFSPVRGSCLFRSTYLSLGNSDRPSLYWYRFFIQLLK